MASKMFLTADRTHLKGLEDLFGAVLVGLLCRKLRFLKLQKLTPQNLQIREETIVTFFFKKLSLWRNRIMV